MPKNTFCLIKTCALISNSLFYSDELNCDIFAGCQRSMSVKHGFNETNIALISVEKLNIFQLKWVIYMHQKIFSLIKLALWSRIAYFTAMNLWHFRRLSTLNASQTWLQSTEYCPHIRLCLAPYFLKINCFCFGQNCIKLRKNSVVRPRTLRNSSLFFYKVMLHTKRFITRFDFQKEQRYLYPAYIF